MRIPTFLLVFLLAGCTSGPISPSPEAARAPYSRRAVYTPSFTRIPKGYRDIFPTGQAPDVAYVGMENQSPEMMQSLQAHLVRFLCNGDYDRFIASIVVTGAYDDGQISFTIWLQDGRRLDSGLVLLQDQEHGITSGTDIGTQLYRHAQKMLRSAVSEHQLQQAKADPGPSL